MASVKKLKSRGRALCGSVDYELRKRAFADTPPALTLRPLRALRRRYEAALSRWHREVSRFEAGKGPRPRWPEYEASTLTAATQAAASGQGDLVRFWSRLAGV